MNTPRSPTRTAAFTLQSSAQEEYSTNLSFFHTTRCRIYAGNGRRVARESFRPTAEIVLYKTVGNHDLVRSISDVVPRYFRPSLRVRKLR